MRTNAELPGRIAEVCAQRGISLIHISTDAVFSGEKSGAYSETDEPSPRSVYARTKLAGEAAVLQAYPQATVARVNFYGWSLSGRRSLAEFFVNNLSRGATVNGFTDVTFCPMFVNHLSAILIKMLSADLPRRVSRGGSAGIDQVPVWRRDCQEIRMARTACIAAIGREIQPGCPSLP